MKSLDTVLCYALTYDLLSQLYPMWLFSYYNR